MHRFVARIWLPDRPGALGLVAGRIGAVRGDVVGIEILERGAGRAIDELIIELPDPGLVGQLINEIAEVDGVDVEDIRPLTGEPHEPELDALSAAARLVEAPAPDRLGMLVAEAHRLLDAEWALAVHPERATPESAIGEHPPVEWVRAFSEGSRHLPDGADAGPDDVAWATMARARLLVAVGRSHRSLRWRERRTLALLVRLADATVNYPPVPSPAPTPGADQRSERSTARRQPA